MDPSYEISIGETLDCDYQAKDNSLVCVWRILKFSEVAHFSLPPQCAR